MVVLNKIYTRTGDRGDTALGNGARVAKHSARVAAYGTSDELNATIGVARLNAEGEMDAALARIQNDLFDLGAVENWFNVNFCCVCWLNGKHHWD